ncbi:NAD(P)/FAD-dependent oxidoreductase [Pseudonocardia sp.]|uniref:flavin-containing monooxygenase n=1 Tax=Pseudonocardia sp. TaxID=60912 RepID=UPI0026322F06|nr:NAD(P)/FAD-dependent oxidoreductase [Pseudonocardia sp.]
MEHVDVLIVGAGLSGIGAGYRLQTEHPGRSYAILEARDAIGGTWDLFRYPGIRSDSDMFTLGYPFRPWTEAKAIADGGSILGYVRDTAAEFGIERHIRFGRRVVAAAWSSTDARWQVEVAVGEETERYTCSFLYLCSGYYSYERAHTPDIPGLADFAGPVVHPQFWPEDLDVTGRRVVVVGSGATAVTLVPALAPQAAHVTMLQRSPSWITVLPGTDAVADALRRHLPRAAAHRVARWKNILTTQGFYQLCRRRPRLAAKLLRAGVARQLADPATVDVDFAPRYDPWDQRLCVVPVGVGPDADLFRAVRSGKASVVTERITRVTATGVRLESGRVLDADVLVTATGLELVACGGIALSVDGNAIDPGETVVYRGCLLSGVPNLAMCVGYTNASWTLRADLASRYVCRLLAHMDSRGATSAVPRPAGPVTARPLLDLSSGYVQRAAARMPKQGGRAPWLLRQNYLLDLLGMRFGDPARDMEFRLPREIDGLRVREAAAGT